MIYPQFATFLNCDPFRYEMSRSAFAVSSCAFTENVFPSDFACGMTDEEPVKEETGGLEMSFESFPGEFAMCNSTYGGPWFYEEQRGRFNCRSHRF